MPIELRLLLWSVILGLVHMVATGMAATASFGLAYNMGARDENKQPDGVAGRIQRAFRNFMESFPFFAAAVAACVSTGRHGWATRTGAELYFWARLAYVPLYAGGIPVVRTLAWGVSVAGIALVLAGVL